jgi:prenyl protein peptidase
MRWSMVDAVDGLFVFMDLKGNFYANITLTLRGNELHRHDLVTRRRFILLAPLMGAMVLDSVVAPVFRAFTYECGLVPSSLGHAVTYSLAVSSAFVTALYVLVPPKIRQLDRNDARQIRWRVLATSAVCIGSVAAYPYIFCDDQVADPSKTGPNSPSSIFSLKHLKTIGGVLLHTATLYLGPILQQLLEVHEIVKRRSLFGIDAYLRTYYVVFIHPIVSSIFNPIDSSERWVCLRNLVAAPVAEEIAFRGCIASSLAAAGMKTSATSLIAPLFFGSAHLHHALLKLYEKQRPSTVLIQTAFQFAYTSLFGSYATYAFLRTRSIVAVSVSHSFCNGMGLPDLVFLRPSSSLYKYRRLLLTAHIIGVVGFSVGFNYSLVFP